jgi:magnesium-transporting ATPase (P-type)
MSMTYKQAHSMDANRSVAAAAGLIAAEAQNRLHQFGPNRVEEEQPHPLLSFFATFWAPVPWMLEVTVLLEILLHKLDKVSSSAYCCYSIPS